MSLFEFLMMLLIIIVGLGISDLLTGLARFVRDMSWKDFCYPHTALVLTLLVVWLQFVWESWGLQRVTHWTFPAMVLMLLPCILLHLVSHLVWPPAGRTDLSDYYFQTAPRIYGLAVMAAIAGVMFRPVALGEALLIADNLSTAPIVALLVLLALWRNRHFHAAATTLCLLMVIADVLAITYEIS